MRATNVKIPALGLSVVAALAGVASALPTVNTTGGACPPFNNGSFTIEAFQLYPENAKFDPVRCVVYFGALFNASVAVFDPYTNTVVESINFPGLSGDPTIHLGPALPDASGRLTVLLDAAAAFSTGGADPSGTNVILQYDLSTNRVVWQHNISAEVTQGRFSGFQDVAHDRHDNVYIVGTFPGTVLRVGNDGAGLAPWFLPDPAALANTTVAGFAGIASIPEKDLLLVNNQADGQIYRFDGVSGAAQGTPVLVPRVDAGNGSATSAPLGASDAILLPPKYKGTVLLVAVDAEGTAVLRSKDGTWRSAETLGLVSNNVPEAMGGLVPAVVQIGPEKVFAVEEFFVDPLVPGTNAGNRTLFPMLDITAQVDALLAKFP